jgi:hypothetical protein
MKLVLLDFLYAKNSRISLSLPELKNAYSRLWDSQRRKPISKDLAQISRLVQSKQNPQQIH